MGLNPCFLTAGTTIDCHQLSLLHIELLGLIDKPFVVAMFAQRFAFVFFLKRGFFEGNNVGHVCFRVLSIEYLAWNRSAFFWNTIDSANASFSHTKRAISMQYLKNKLVL